MRLQRFTNVCDGGHLHHLDNMTKEDLAKGLGLAKKAILIVGNGQFAALKVLRNLNRKSGRVVGLRMNYNFKTGTYDLRLPLRAKEIGRWSSTASIWLVRQDTVRL